jgi:hypothetical protein
MSSDLLKGGNLFTAAVIGIGASVLGPVVMPAFRPIAKSLIKGGLIAFDQGRTAWAELNEKTSDMIAEAREEMETREVAERAPAQAQTQAKAAASAARKPARKTSRPRKPAEARPH